MNWLKRRKLSTQIIIGVSTTTILSILIVLFISGLNATNVILQNTYNTQEQMSERYAEIISRRMNEPVILARNVGENLAQLVYGDSKLENGRNRGRIKSALRGYVRRVEGVRSVEIRWFSDEDQSQVFDVIFRRIDNTVQEEQKYRFEELRDSLVKKSLEEKRDVLSEPVVHRMEKRPNAAYDPNNPDSLEELDRRYLSGYVAIPVKAIGRDASVAVMLIEYDFDSFFELISNMDIPDKSFATILSGTGVFVATTTETSIGLRAEDISAGGKSSEKSERTEEERKETEFGFSELEVDYNGLQVLLVSYLAPIQVSTATEKWAMAITLPELVIELDAYSIQIQAAIVGVIMVLIATLVAWLSGRALAKPVVELTKSMNDITSGNLDITIQQSDSENEIGLMRNSVSVFLDNARNLVKMEEEQKESAYRAEQEKKAMIDTMANNLESNMNASIQGLVTSAQGFMSAGDVMQASLGKVTEYTQDVSAGSGETSSSIQTVAAACQELSISITEISGQVSDSAQRANEASDAAKASNELVGRLEKAADQIGNVVALINEIAEQTNLLALNATIEAARAGEAGKGFAVVAGEVKNLAAQTASATDEISSQIRAIQSEAGETANAINRIASQVSEISNVSTTIAAAVEEQSAATDEISRNVTFASEGAQNINGKMTLVSDANMDANDAASKVKESTDVVVQQTEALRNSLYAFLDDLRKDQ